MKESEIETNKLWKKTRVANLVRYEPSGVYFARVRVSGKLIRRSLKTTAFTVAQTRLADLVRESREMAEGQRASMSGKMLFGDAVDIYEQRLKADQRLKPNSKHYRLRLIQALLKSWPGLKLTDLRKISESDCMEWAAKFGKEYSSTVYNNTVGTLRHIFDIAIKAGARYGNPANAIRKVRVRSKNLNLPEHDKFLELVETVENAGGRFSQGCADLMRFLTFGGFRKGEASLIKGSDCDFEKGEIIVRGSPETGTKNWETRRVPMISDMRVLLERLQSEKGEEWLNKPVMEVQECQKAIDSACRKLGISRITHHDLRHLFATRCIESGVDIPTVSRWLGHKDGGALAMKVYGHLRDQHSSTMAQRVTFSKPTGKNILPIHKEILA